MNPATSPFKLVLAYAIFAALWILLSDQAAAWLFVDPLQLLLAGTIKGWLFVAVTSLLLYGLIRRLLDKAIEGSRRELEAQKEKARVRQLLAAIADNSSDAIFAKDLDGRYLLFNSAAARVVGKAVDAVLGQDDTALFPPAQAAMIRSNDLGVIRQCRTNTYEEHLLTVAGERWFLATKGPLLDGDGTVSGMFGISRDITGIKDTEDRLRRANRALYCLSACNALLARATDEPAMLQDVCRLVVDLGGYRMAWVGYAGDDPQRTVIPVANAGVGAGYLEAAGISWAADEHGRGPTGTAIRERHAVVARDIISDPHFEPWRAAAILHGYASSVALPLLTEADRCVGALNIYAPEADAFDDEELRFLAELAGNLAYGMRALHDRQGRSAAEAALRESEAKFRAIIESSPVALAVVDENRNIVFANPQFVETFGYTLADIPTLDDWRLRAYPDPADRQRVAQFWNEAVAATMEDRKPHSSVEYRVTCKDGTVRDILFRVAPTGTARLVIMVDLTERKQAEEQIRAQLDELLRWQRLTVGREERMLQLKGEVNELLARAGQPPRYSGGAEP